MILRRYIGKRLSEYYNQPSHLVVGSGSKAQKKSLLDQVWLGEWHYKYLYSKYYHEGGGQWLTPVELLAPYYSQILANYILAASSTANANASQPIRIVELGGGHGTNAKHMLHYLSSSKKNPSVVVDSYTILDASPTLQQHQRQVLKSTTTSTSTQLHFVSADIMTLAEAEHPKDEVFSTIFHDDDDNIMTFVLGLEVLDNLPHDKVQKVQFNPTNNNNKEEEAPSYLQAQVNLEQMTEEMVPLQDPLLERIVPHYPLHPTSQAQWIPSVACGFVSRLLQQCRNVTALFADFDYLPPPSLFTAAGNNDVKRKSIPALEDTEPILTCMNDQDHACYLTYLDHCDILYPTNFHSLAQFVRNCTASNIIEQQPQVNVMKQADFLQRYGPQQIQATTSFGYTPLLHDFSNCSIITITSNR